MSVLFECTCSQTILKTYIISYYILHIICMETKRKTAYLCFLYFREWRDPIQNRRRKLSFTSLIEACFKFKSTIHDDFAFVHDRGGFKTLYETLWDHQRFTDH